MIFFEFKTFYYTIHEDLSVLFELHISKAELFTCKEDYQIHKATKVSTIQNISGEITSTYHN